MEVGRAGSHFHQLEYPVEIVTRHLEIAGIVEVPHAPSRNVEHLRDDSGLHVVELVADPGGVWKIKGVGLDREQLAVS